MTDAPTNLEARREAIRAVIRSAGSTIFSVKFYKKDGSLRTMQVQLPAIRNLLVGDDASDSAKQGVATRHLTHPELFAVYSVGDDGIRQVNIDKLVEVNLRGYASRWSLPTQVAA